MYCVADCGDAVASFSPDPDAGAVPGADGVDETDDVGDVTDDDGMSMLCLA